MKSESFFIGSQASKQRVLQRIQSLDIDGGVKVTIGDGRSKSARQRALQWMWNTEVSNSGVGGKHEDTKEGVHVVSKWRFGRPLIAQFMPEQFKFIKALEDKYRDNPDAMYYIADKFISTEDFEVPIMAKYLTEFQKHYGIKHGVNLTIPDQGLLDYAESQNQSKR